MTRVGPDPYRIHLAAATLALARQWDVPVRTASETIANWSASLEVPVEDITDAVLDEVYEYWRRHGGAGADTSAPGGE